MKTEHPQTRGVAFFLLIMGALICTAARCSSAPKVFDSSMLAAAANDSTAIIEGCGGRPAVGYAFCRVHEGDGTTGRVTVQVPPAECPGPGSCATVRFLYPDGSPSLGLAVPRGTSSISASWLDLTKMPVFERNQRGFWGVQVFWRFYDEEGREVQGYAEGEIRLRVLARGYTALHEVRDADVWGWEWANATSVFRMSTAGRAYAGDP